MRGGLPSLPPRGDKRGPPPAQQGNAEIDALKSKAADLVTRPAVQKLLQNPELFQQSPAFQSLLEQSPELAALANPATITKALEHISGGVAASNVSAAEREYHLLKLQERLGKLESFNMPQLSQPQLPTVPAASSVNPAAVRAPLQQASFYSSSYNQASAYEGSFSYEHSEQELPVSSLPREIQEQVLGGTHYNNNQHSHQHHAGCSHNHGHSHVAPSLVSTAQRHQHQASSESGIATGHSPLSNSRNSSAAGIDGFGQSGEGPPHAVSPSGGSLGTVVSFAAWQASRPNSLAATPTPGQHRLGGTSAPPWGLAGIDEGSASELGQGPAGRTKTPDPKTYYEQVEPSKWRPEQDPETSSSWTHLYRKAYMRYWDFLMYPSLFALVALIIYAVPPPHLKFHWLLAAVGGLAVAGSMLGSALMPPSERARAKRGDSVALLAFISTIEVVYPIVYVYQMLPEMHVVIWTSGRTLVLLAALAAMPLLHVAAATADPGYVSDETAGGGKSVAATAGGRGELPLAAGLTKGNGAESSAHRAASEPLLDGRAAGHAANEAGQRQQQAAGGTATAAGGSSTQGATANADGNAAGAAAASSGEKDVEAAVSPGANAECVTCLLPRPMRSKHCPLCDRCVRRMDHHCPAIANCVGENNERAFAAWLFAIVTAQVLFIAEACAFIMARHTAVTLAEQQQQATELTATTMLGGSRALAQALWWAQDGARGVLILAALQVGCMIPALLLATRQLFCIAANLTANELINRQRYAYLLQPAGVGGAYCNRFDRGVARNCLQFWFERPRGGPLSGAPHGPQVRDTWRHVWEQGEQELHARKASYLRFWSLTTMVRWYEGKKSAVVNQRDKMLGALVDHRTQRAMRAMEVRAQAAATAQAARGAPPGS